MTNTCPAPADFEVHLCLWPVPPHPTPPRPLCQLLRVQARHNIKPKTKLRAGNPLYLPCSAQLPSSWRILGLVLKFRGTAGGTGEGRRLEM